MVESDHKKKNQTNLINDPATIKSVVAADLCQTHVVFIVIILLVLLVEEGT